jgi:hypothetical protein
MEKKEIIRAVSCILGGSLLQMFDGIGHGWAASVVAIIGLIIMLMGLNKFKTALDANGQSGVKLLVVAIILSLVGVVFGMIPLLGLVVASVFVLAAFVVELIGFLKLKSSESIGERGKSGVSLLLTAMILGILSGIFGLLPFAGKVFVSIFSIISILLIFYGWLRIQEGVME